MATRDLYSIQKIDTHVHHSAAFSKKMLIEFMKEKITSEPDVVVMLDSQNQPMTLAQVFEDLNITKDKISLNTLNVHADHLTFARFDKFNMKLNLMGKQHMRDIFLRYDNFMEGRYLSELTHRLMKDFESK